MKRPKTNGTHGTEAMKHTIVTAFVKCSEIKHWIGMSNQSKIATTITLRSTCPENATKKFCFGWK